MFILKVPEGLLEGLKWTGPSNAHPVACKGLRHPGMSRNRDGMGYEVSADQRLRLLIAIFNSCGIVNVIKLAVYGT